MEPSACLQFGGDLERGFALAALLQRYKHRRRVRRGGEGRAVETGEGDGGERSGVFQRDRLCLPQDLVGALQRGTRRQLDDADQIALVLRGDEPVGVADSRQTASTISTT